MADGESDLKQGGDPVLESDDVPPPRRKWKAGSARVLRAVLAGLLVAILVRGILLLTIMLTAQNDSWDLPNGAVLEHILSSCQVEHWRRAGIESEQLVCPTRLPARAFPKVLRDAVVASEDARFFEHGAIDVRSSLRAAWHLVSGSRQGGSTITQQLARSLLLRKEDSFDRKLLEAVLAIRIFAILTPDQILTRYMNAVPHARSMHGFDDPARYYFGVPAHELDLAEAALLVGMLPEPNNRDPLKDPAAALDGAVVVLHRMEAEDKISAEEAASAERELKRRVLGGDLRRGDQKYARLEYRPYRDLALREARASGMSLGPNYRLILFMDPQFQKELVSQICAITGQHKAAGFFMRPSGEVLATAGSCQYTGRWNRAADISRSIGSTGKLFPLIGAHELGVDMSERVSTRPLRRSGWPNEPSSKCLARRSVSLTFALDHSCNRPWAEMATRLGPRLHEITDRFGLDAPKIPALVPLGGLYTSPMKLTQAYASLRNAGRVPQISFLVAAIGPKGNVIGIPRDKPERKGMSRGTAAAVLQDLRGPVRRGTAKAANSAHALVYGKTGTSSKNADALFVGLTRDFVGCVWVGHDRMTPMPGVHGGGAPARAFSKLTDFYYLRLARARYAEAHKNTSDKPWDGLETLAPREQTVRQLAMLGSMLAACFLLAGLFTTGKER